LSGVGKKSSGLFFMVLKAISEIIWPGAEQNLNESAKGNE
jgi:hypothetical protein